MKTAFLCRSSRGFSLVEILAVLVIIGILAAIAVPMMKSPSRAIQIKSAADLMKSELLLARQQATTMNGQVEVRFFKDPASDGYSAYQIFTINGDGTKTPFSKLRMLPSGLVLPDDSSVSPLLTESTLTGTQEDGAPAVKGWSYSALNIRSSGEFTDVAQDKAFVTLLEASAPKVSGNLPANYAVVQVQPTTGMITVTQP